MNDINYALLREKTNRFLARVVVDPAIINKLLGKFKRKWVYSWHSLKEHKEYSPPC